MSANHDLRARALFDAFASGRINRREMLTRAAGLGVGLTALGGLFSTQHFTAGVSAQDAVELAVAINQDIDALDPHKSQLLLFNNVIRLNVFNSLVKYGPNLEYVGDLAESWENPDDKTYIFKLRSGVTYHNGQAFEASHVQFSYERLAGLDSITRTGEIVLCHDAFADGRDLVDNGPPPTFDRGMLARSVLDRISSPLCPQLTLSDAVAHGTPVWREWRDAP